MEAAERVRVFRVAGLTGRLDRDGRAAFGAIAAIFEDAVSPPGRAVK